MPILSIIIPTFNRVFYLKKLVSFLYNEIKSINANYVIIELLITDNNSEDGTSDFLNQYNDIEWIKLHRQDINKGPAINLIFGFENATGEYIWIIGDDDLPTKGLILKIRNFLISNKPDLIYLPSKWIMNEIDDINEKIGNNETLYSCNKSNIVLASEMNITFTSAWLINKKNYINYTNSNDYMRYRNTSFPHLEYILENLVSGESFAKLSGVGIIAKAGNSGGYNLFNAFIIQYTNIILNKLKYYPRFIDFYLNCNKYKFLPGLIRNINKNTAGKFIDVKKKDLNLIAEESPYYNNVLYKYLLVNIINNNKLVSFFSFILLKISGGILIIINKLCIR